LMILAMPDLSGGKCRGGTTTAPGPEEFGSPGAVGQCWRSR
jgi:hypothetical protein